MGGNGPGDLKTKTEILKFLKDSLALGHKSGGYVDYSEHVADRGKSD